jgi:hypothetical protein
VHNHALQLGLLLLLLLLSGGGGCGIVPRLGSQSLREVERDASVCLLLQESPLLHTFHTHPAAFHTPRTQKKTCE